MKRLANIENLQHGVTFNSRRISSIAATAKLETTTHPNPHLYNSNSTHLANLHTLLQICAKKRAAMEGKGCHSHVITLGLQSDTLTSNILINFYSKCGLIDSARHVFDEMPARTIVSWNTIIGTYAQNKNDEEAFILFKNMRNNGTLFSEFTVSSVLCACATKFAVFECKQLHAFSLKTAMGSNVFVGTALLDVYAKCGFVMEASRVFEGMGEKSEVTWSSMLAGYAQNEMYEDALNLFKKAQVMGLEHNQFSISSVLSACAGLATLIEGKQVHSVLSKAGFNSNIFVASSLIDVYAKCGNIKDAYSVFLGVEDRNLVLWNAMICGFSKHACSFEVMILFEKMQQTGICPNELTYISLLSVCSHIGLVEEGRIYFDLMIKQHNITPNVFHYSCMVDILGRAGLVFEAIDTIQNMPSSLEATASMWGSLLSSCRIYKNLELAEIAAKKLFEMEPSNAGNHVLLSNIYALNKKWDEVAKSRQLLKTSEATKEKGKSWIEIKDKVHTFMVGEINHPRISEIYSELEDLMKELKRDGYIVVIEHELHNVEEKRKHELLRYHSEKLALTFGLMCLAIDAPIRIMKNLRICGDCHSFMKFVSCIKGRDIIVRDTNRFHHFTNGCCSCKDFW